MRESRAGGKELGERGESRLLGEKSLVTCNKALAIASTLSKL
ncbi:MAG: hypothetical protein CLLPBCKN_005737 [Chroococcidiopsis cubana SAG 39.79]|jgi:hypothetical protein|nr:hypothetical protein [Chroococcidiopsis cubana SAG 39.79]